MGCIFQFLCVKYSFWWDVYWVLGTSLSSTDQSTLIMHTTQSNWYLHTVAPLLVYCLPVLILCACLQPLLAVCLFAVTQHISGRYFVWTGPNGLNSIATRYPVFMVCEEVRYFISKRNSWDFEHSDRFECFPGSHSRSVSCALYVGITSSCSLLTFILPVSLASSHLHFRLPLFLGILNL